MAADPAATQLFYGLPVVVWSGIFAAGMTLIGTLGGVIATNWGNTKRLRLQLEHDRTEKAKERLAAMRRELYLKAVEANIHGGAYLGKLPHLDLTKPEADAPMLKVLAMGAQLQLVVSQETAQLVSELIAAYSELHFKLIAKVLPIHSERSDIAFCNEQYDNVQVELKRVLAAMTQYNESSERNPDRFHQLSLSFEFAQRRSQEVADERSAHWVRFNDLQRQYLRGMLPESKRIAELQVQVLVALRREVDVGGDIDVFQQMMRKQIERMELAVDDFDRTVFGD